MSRTRRVWGTSGAAMAALALVAASAPLVSAKGPVTIVWAASPIVPGLRHKLIQQFEASHPDIRVKLVSQPTNTDTNRAELVTQISSGSSTPDVYMGDVIWPAQFGHDGLALPLSRYLPQSFFKRFAPGLVAGATYQGHVWAAPFFMDAGFLYYRKDLLAKEHLPVPKTWEQLVKEAQLLQKAGLVKYGYVWEGASYEGLTCDWMEVMSDAGGKVFGPGNRVAIDSAASLKALQFLRSLIVKGISPAAETTFQEPQAMNTFAAGQAAFLRNWDYAWSVSQTPSSSKVVGKVGVAPLPTFAGHPYPGYSNIGGWDLYINPHSKHLKQDLTFIKWMTSVPAQTTLATFASEIPTNYAVQKNPKVRAENPVLAIVSKVRLIPRPAQTPAYPKVSAAIYQNVNAALAGTVSPAQALKKAAQEIKAALSGSSL